VYLAEFLCVSFAVKSFGKRITAKVAKEIRKERKEKLAAPIWKNLFAQPH
jgi:hypothetical protein